VFAIASCARQPIDQRAHPDDRPHLNFRNDTEDEVRVYIYEGEKPWLIGSVQAFRRAQLLIPTDLTTRGGELVVVAAVPVGGRGRTGDAASGAIVRADAEPADHITQFNWTLVGHTLSGALSARVPR